MNNNTWLYYIQDINTKEFLNMDKETFSKGDNDCPNTNVHFHHDAYFAAVQELAPLVSKYNRSLRVFVV